MFTTIHAQRLPGRDVHRPGLRPGRATSSSCAARCSPATPSATWPSPAPWPPPRWASTRGSGCSPPRRGGRLDDGAGARARARGRRRDRVGVRLGARARGAVPVRSRHGRGRRTDHRGARAVRVDLGSVSGAARAAALVAVGVVVAIVLAMRPLLSPRWTPSWRPLAGVPVRPLGLGFLVALALTTAEATQAVGALLLLGCWPPRRGRRSSSPTPNGPRAVRAARGGLRCGPGWPSATRCPRCPRAPRSSRSPPRRLRDRRDQRAGASPACCRAAGSSPRGRPVRVGGGRLITSRTSCSARRESARVLPGEGSGPGARLHPGHRRAR